MTAGEVKQALNDRAEEFCRSLFPVGWKESNHWRVGSLNGEQGQSLGVCIAGSKVGVWRDFATDEGGGNLLELFMKARRTTFPDALRACAAWLGVQVDACDNDRFPSRLRPTVAARSQTTGDLSLILPIPDAVAAAWSEGVDHILGRKGIAASLAAFRGWPVEFAQYLIDCAAISMPLCRNERGLAFMVMAPDGKHGAMTTRSVGYHIRLRGKPGEKCSWLYFPNDRSNGTGIPALPFILGEFEEASLLVITEGQWDALAFALAAGWLGDGALWPPGVGLIGIRGASGVRPFLERYERFWPDSASCLLLADADNAGASWIEGDHCFAKQLARRCTRVAVVDCHPHKDFNDLYRVEKPGSDVIRGLLASHDMALEREVLS